ncbi:MAG: PAS domain S-box protein [Thermoplasmata archaeon]
MVQKSGLEEELDIYKNRLDDAMKAGNLAWWEMELPSGKVRFHDKKAEMLGYSPERFDHYEDFTELLHPEDHDKAMRAMRDHLEGEKERYEVEYKIKKKNGGYKWFRDVGSITEEAEDYKKVTGIVIDIDERKKWEKRLKESEERYRTLVETSIVGVAKTDLDNHIDFVNQAFADLLGYSRDDLYGMNLSEITPEKEYKKIDEKTTARKDEEHEIYESKFLTKSGKTVEVLISASPYRNAEGEIVGTIGVVQNISKRKNAEERKDLFHSLLRHDIRNKAQVVQGYLQLLEERNELSKDSMRYISEALEANKESMNLIQKVRFLLTAEEEEKKPVIIKATMQEAVKMNEERAEEEGIDIDLDCPSMEYKVEGGTLLKEVFSNIIENSILHSDCEKIKVSGEVLDKKVVCSIEDDGKGIPDDKKDVIFEKGYTTDEERGTGLGMFLVKMLLEIYEGDIKVRDSQLGGARFDIFLKRIEENN